MSFIEKEISGLKAENSLIIKDLVMKKIGGAQSSLYLEPLTTPQGKPLFYYDKPISVTTEETKGIRKISRLFNRLAKLGVIPEASPANLAIEWGKADGMRLAFLPVGDTFIHAKEFSLNGKEVNERQVDINQVYVSGTCIFGKSAVKATTSIGKILYPADPYLMQREGQDEYGCISSLEFSDNLHTYEVMGALSRGNILNNIGASRVYFNIPITPYIFYAKDMIVANLMAPELLATWVGQVQKRAEQLIAYEKSVCKAEVVPVDPLYAYLDVVCSPETTLETFANLLSKQDEWWRLYLQKSPAKIFSDLGYASYVRVYYELLGNGNSANRVVAVEDQTEMRLFLEVKKLIESGALPQPSKNSSMVGLYPFTPLIFPDENGMADAIFLSDRSNFDGAAEFVFSSVEGVIDKKTIESAKAACAYMCNIEHQAIPNIQALNMI